MKYVLILGAGFLVSGCSLFQTKPEIQTIKVIEKVPCKVTMPEKPVYPLDSAKKSDDIFLKGQKALSEIEIREAYTIKLEAAIKECNE